MNLVLLALMTLTQAGAPLAPVVEAEDVVYTYQPAKNGADPMWCHGATCLVRVGEQVFASGIETLPDTKPLNNVRWQLFGRGPQGWQLLHKDQEGLTREPCPLGVCADGRLFLSANPTLTPKDTYDGPARPEVWQFSIAEPTRAPERIVPKWAGEPPFREHSYRSFAADGPNNELFLAQNIEYDHAEWTFRDRDGNWSKQGRLEWPFGKEYDKPQPIRVCYPNVALKDRAVYFCGVSDIIEPYDAWRAYKFELTKAKWDYDFRRLFFTWSPDITRGEFQPWVEIASRDKTAGGMFPRDLSVGADGRVHLLWTERGLDERLREKFFPGEKQFNSLNYAVVRDGEVVLRKTLMRVEEGEPQVVPGYARFHVTPDNRLFVFYYVNGSDASGKSVSENRLLELRADGGVSESVRVPLEHPLSAFFTATCRGGSAPSQRLDLLGTRADGANTMGYACVRIP